MALDVYKIGAIQELKELKNFFQNRLKTLNITRIEYSRTSRKGPPKTLSLGARLLEAVA